MAEKFKDPPPLPDDPSEDVIDMGFSTAARKEDTVIAHMSKAKEYAYNQSCLIVNQDTGEQKRFSLVGGTMAPLGTGIGLYFKWLKFVSYLFLLGALLSIAPLVLNVRGDRLKSFACRPDDPLGAWQRCSGNWMIVTSLGNNGTSSDINVLYGICWFIWVLVFVIFCWRFEFYIRNAAIDLNRRSVAPEDYTLVIYNPHNVLDTKQYVEYFSTWGEVAAVSLGVNFGEMAYLQKYIDNTEDQVLMHKAEKSKGRTLLSMCTVGDPLKRSEDKLRRLRARMEVVKRTDLVPHRAFVTFNYEEDATKCLKAHTRFGWKRFLPSCCVNLPRWSGRHIHLARASSPSDVLWENLYLNRTRRRMRVGVAGFTTLLLLGIGFGLMLLIQLTANDVNHWIRVGGAVVISIINTLLVYSLTALTEWTRPHTHTEYHNQLLVRLTLALFLNSGVLVFVVSMAGGGGSPATKPDSWYYGTGVQFYSILITELVIQNVVKFINPGTLIKQWLLAPRQATQRSMNAMMLGPEFILSAQYASCLKTILLTVCVSVALPVAPFIGYASLVVSYWVDKHHLLRKCRRPPGYGPEAAFHSLMAMRWGLALATLLVPVFYIPSVQTPGEITAYVLSWVAFGIALIALLRSHFRDILNTCWYCRSRALDVFGDQGTDGKAFLDVYGLDRYTPPPVRGLTLAWELGAEEMGPRRESKKTTV